MTVAVDVEAILKPFPGDNPAGEDLRYSAVYEEIKEARRADDPFDRGDWQREIKKSDWNRVMELASQILTQRTKDLQIAVWLTEGLINKSGFSGLLTGLRIVNGFLTLFWETVYPRIEDDDLEFRAAPLEFLNEKIWVAVKEVPLTDEASTTGYSWFKWKESREVGYEADTKNRYGDIDEGKKRVRDEQLADGKLSAEDFDAAVSQSSLAFYTRLAGEVAQCREEFRSLDAAVDERFGRAAPRLAELKGAIEDCEDLVLRIFKDKGGSEPVAESKADEGPRHSGSETALEREAVRGESQPLLHAQPLGATAFRAVAFPESPEAESTLWESALATMNVSGIRAALGQLLAASCGAPSVREANRLKLLMARLCLEAGRPDLARPIVEELHALIEELHLERWESPVWIAEVLDALYRCLTFGEPSDDDMSRARGLFQKLCTTDVTRAIPYKP
ncbi:MAG: type VI secretion system protein TssA [Syntrophobacteraceae bacterium]|jgi:type VI secretion system protein ImpA|nr:type VI secretion system protein TssA [Syntrophobacteraceae bacterium]